MREKRGVSPIVAEVLLILIIVAGSVVLFSWMHGASSDDATQEAPNSKLVVKGVTINETSGNATIYLQNIGETTARADTIYLLSPEGNIIGKWDVNVEVPPGGTAEVEVTIPSLDPGGGYIFKVAGSSTAPYTLNLYEDLAGCPPPGWTYYRVINITNPASTGVTLFPVRIEFNISNFDFSKTRVDGGDVRFYATDCRAQLYYWIEQWDPLVGHGVAWVLVPSLPAGETVQVVMAYGNPAATFDPVYLNATKLFLFYDDAENFTGWEQHGTGLVLQNNTIVYQGAYSIEKTRGCYDNGGVKNIGLEIGATPFVLEFYIYRDDSNLTCPYDSVNLQDGDGNGYGLHIGHGNAADRPNIGVHKRENYEVTGQTSTSIPEDPLDRWVLARLIWLANGTTEAYLYNLDGTLIGKSTYTDTSFDRFTHVALLGGATYYVDLLRIAPLLPDPSNPYPLTSIGSEMTR